MGYPDELKAHLQSGYTTIARAWAVTRRDGRVLGFTDHDGRLGFDGIAFEPDSGMTAKAIARGTGLSVDNTESYGALSSDAISEADILAGRYDGAEIRAWIVNWADVRQRALLFRGHLGDITRGAGAFTAELRGLAEALGVERGQVYHPKCAAVLGDSACRFDLDTPGFCIERDVEVIEDGVVLRFGAMTDFPDRWFEKGRVRMLGGAATGLVGAVKRDRILDNGQREIDLWQRFGADVVSGDRIRIDAGCDKRSVTCRTKFENFANFRGFPHIPGDDWLISYPVRSGVNNGGSLFK